MAAFQADGFSVGRSWLSVGQQLRSRAARRERVVAYLESQDLRSVKAMEALTATEWKEFRMGTHLNLGQLSWLRKAMHESHAPGDAQEKSHLADGLLLGRCCKRDARPHTVD